MKKIGLLIASALLVTASFAQKAEIAFNKTVHDYGQVNEEDGKVKCTFEFTNTGDAPLVLNSVTASCGCTSPSWTREPVAPGAKGKIDVEYSASGRVGPINKSITVKSNAATNGTELLRITGEVLPRGQAKPFAIAVGDNFRLKTNVADFGKIEKGNSVIYSLDIQNVGKETVKIAVENLPTYLTAVAAPAQLKESEKGKINLTFNSANLPSWGQVNEKVTITINGTQLPLTVNGTIIDNFAKLTKEQKQNAPIADVTATYSFGQVKAGTKKSYKLKIANKGVDALEIRYIDNKNPEFAVGKIKAIAGGKSANLDIELATKGQAEGSYKKTFTVQTNDPNNPVVLVTLDWTVVK